MDQSYFFNAIHTLIHNDLHPKEKYCMLSTFHAYVTFFSKAAKLLLISFYCCTATALQNNLFVQIAILQYSINQGSTGPYRHTETAKCVQTVGEMGRGALVLATDIIQLLDQ